MYVYLYLKKLLLLWKIKTGCKGGVQRLISLHW